MKYVALLRGINVGGNSLIKMSELKIAFEKLSFENVITYINSGNVIFESDDSPAKIKSDIEKSLIKNFKLEIKIMLRSHKEIKNTLNNVPSDWKNKKDLRCYIAFVRDPSTPADVISETTLREGIDAIKEGPGVVYMTTKLSGITKSGFSKLASKKIYKEITIRNYTTAEKLLSLMEK